MPRLVLVHAHDAVARSLSLPITFVYVWCSSLCECFHCSAHEAMSHSYVVEWIGSRIQSHWPWRMLCPISMFSRILATLRPRCRRSRPAGTCSREHRAAAELEPALDADHLADVRRVGVAAVVEEPWRISSSSLPSSSMSSAVRWAMGLVGFFCRAVM